MAIAAIITPAEVIATGNLPSDTSTSDTLLELCILSAQEMCEKYCGYGFYTGSVTEYQDSVDAEREIYLARKEVSGTGFKLYYDSTCDFTASTEVDSTTYHLDTTEGKIVLDITYEAGVRRWKITYTGGWTDATAPDGLRYAVIALASLLFKRAKAGLFGQDTDSIGQMQNLKLQAFSPIPQDIRGMLELYRRHV